MDCRIIPVAVINGFRKALAQHLKMTEDDLHEPLEILVQTGILREEKGKFTRGLTRIHLDADSPLIRKHHANWRHRAMENVDRQPLQTRLSTQKSAPLHYSLVMSLAKSDVERVRNLLLKTIEETDIILKPSPEEMGVCLNIDLFEI